MGFPRSPSTKLSKISGGTPTMSIDTKSKEHKTRLQYFFTFRNKYIVIHSHIEIHLSRAADKHFASSPIPSLPHQATNKPIHKYTRTIIEHANTCTDHSHLLSACCVFHVSMLYICSLCKQMIRNKDIPWAVPTLIASVFKQALGLLLRLS